LTVLVNDHISIIDLELLLDYVYRSAKFDAKFSTFSLACLFTVHRRTKLLGPKVKYYKQASEKVEKFRIKFRRSVNVA